MINRSIMSLALIGFAFSMSGCAGMGGDFGCNATTGDQCLTVTETNSLARNGMAGQSPTSGYTQGQHEDYSKVHSGAYPLKPPMPGVPVRAGESVQRLWVGPWIDSEHSFHEPSVVYFVKTPSHWNTLSVKGVSAEGE